MARVTVLLNDVVEVFDLAHFNAGLVVSIVAFELPPVLAPLLSIVIFSGKYRYILSPCAENEARLCNPAWRSVRSPLYGAPACLSTALVHRWHFQTPLTFPHRSRPIANWITDRTLARVQNRVSSSGTYLSRPSD